jgi:SPP1 family predicted phage head-tail adaptor
MRTRRTIGEIQKPKVPGDYWIEGEAIPERFADCYCDIRPLSGQEQLLAQQTEATVTHRIGTEFIPGVTPEMKVVAGGRVFEIVSVVNVNEANRSLELNCIEQVGTSAPVGEPAETVSDG